MPQDSILNMIDYYKELKKTMGIWNQSCIDANNPLEDFLKF